MVSIVTKNHKQKNFAFLSAIFSILLLSTTLHQLQAVENTKNEQLKFIGIYLTENELEKSLQRLKSQGLTTVVKTKQLIDSYTSLEFGPFSFKRDAVDSLQPLKDKGFKAVLVERNYDFIVELGRFVDPIELKQASQRAKSLGYSLLREVPVENKITQWALYTKPLNKFSASVQPKIRTDKTIENYASRQEALKKAKLINRDKASRAFVIQKKKLLKSYFLGPYSSLKKVNSILKTLNQHQIKSRLKWDKTKLSYVIQITSTAPNIVNSLEKLSVTPIREEINTHLVYEVVVQSRNKTPTKKTLVNPSKIQSQIVNYSLKKLKNAATVLTTLSDSRAKQKVSELKRKGVSSEVHQQIEEVALEALVLTNITSWKQARKIAKKLKQQGIDAFPISNRHDKNFSVSIGYSVSVGIYQNRENIKNQLKKVNRLGYNNVEIVNYKKQITSYKVIAEKTNTEIKSTPQLSNQTQQQLNFSEQHSSFFDESEDEEMLVFLDTDSLSTGGESDSTDQLLTENNPYQYALESVSSSYNLQPDRDDVDGIFTTRVKAYATANFSSGWDAKLSLAIKYWNQQGLLKVDHTELLADNAFVRYRGSNYRVTVGNQSVLWGRLDGDAPTDMMSSRDLSFLFLDSDLDAKRISDTSLRVEGYLDQYKLDFLVTPKPHATLLPEKNSSWAFINRTSGRILGVEPLPIIEALTMNGTIEQPKQGKLSWGARLSHVGENLDYAITAQQTRIQTPFYSINPETLFLLLNGNSLTDSINLTEGDTFLVYQPETRVIGGDFGWVEGVSTIRGEIAWLSDYPVIRESTLQFDTSTAINWGIALETYPEGTEDTRIIMQIVGIQILDTEDILGTPSRLAMNGQLETFFMRDRWRMRINFLASFNKKDFYINPEISYTGLTNNEFYLGFHYFEGDPDTLGGFFENSTTLSIGWKKTFN